MRNGLCTHSGKRRCMLSFSANLALVDREHNLIYACYHNSSFLSPRLLYVGQGAASRNKHRDPVLILRILEELLKIAINTFGVTTDPNSVSDAKRTNQYSLWGDNVKE